MLVTIFWYKTVLQCRVCKSYFSLNYVHVFLSFVSHSRDAFLKNTTSQKYTMRSGALAYVWMKWEKPQDRQYLYRFKLGTSQMLFCSVTNYSNLFSYTLYPLEISWDKYSVLNNTNYNKIFHINTHFVHKHQIQLYYNYIKTFLTFAAQAVFHNFSSVGGSNVHKTLFIYVKSFHQYKKLGGIYQYFRFPAINFGS